MEFAVTGATGFLGTRLRAFLETQGHTIRALPRDGGSVDGADAVIHLAGEPVAQRWTAAAKRRIRDSRVLGTERLLARIAEASRRPGVLVCASAIGYYGDRGEVELTECSPPGSGFLPETCVEWEQAASKASDLGLRVVSARIGLVLAANGGALQKMLPPFRLGLGGPIGDGRQWMSWIHATDLVRLLVFCATHDSVSGPVNAVAPQSQRNAAFTRMLAGALHRPAVIPVPKFALHVLYGEMAQIVYGSSRVLPKAAEAAGFSFEYPSLGPALEALQLR